MKLKALGNLCKKNNAFVLCDKVNENGEITKQWLGDGSALYPLENLPILSEKHLITLFDLKEKQVEEMRIERVPLPMTYNFDDTICDELLLERYSIQMDYGCNRVRSFLTSDGIYFFRADHFSLLPVGCDLYERRDTNGQIYIVAKTGYLLIAAIMPIQIIDEMLVIHLTNIASKTGAALVRDKERRRFFETEEQLATPI